MANVDKLAELVLYISTKAQDDPSYGSTKLAKILFFADFAYYQLHGHSITGAEYICAEFGPVPRSLKPTQVHLVSEGALAIQRVSRLGRPQKRPIPLRAADIGGFSGPEIAMVDEVMEEFRYKSARDVSNLSHTFNGWRAAEDKEIIPYEVVLVSRPELTQSEYDFAKSLKDLPNE